MQRPTPRCVSNWSPTITTTLTVKLLHSGIILVRMHSHTITHNQAHHATLRHTQQHSHTHRHTQIHSDTLRHTQTHTHTDTHTDTHTHTHRHTRHLIDSMAF